MVDIVEQLRAYDRGCVNRHPLFKSAADEIERLRSLADDLARVLLLVNDGPDSWGLVEEVQAVMARYRNARQR